LILSFRDDYEGGGKKMLFTKQISIKGWQAQIKSGAVFHPLKKKLP
jgi:hypothetical protein